jgi:hypothetical protein
MLVHVVSTLRSISIICLLLTFSEPLLAASLTVPQTHINGTFTVSWNYSDLAATHQGIRLQESKNSSAWTDVNISNAFAGSRSFQYGAGSYSYRIMVCQVQSNNCNFVVHQTKTIRINADTGFLAADVGVTGTRGTTQFNNNTITTSGSGGDIEGAADAFHFLYRQAIGDVQITARLTSVTNTDNWTKFGLMVRRDLTPGAVNAFLLLRPRDGARYQFRPSTGMMTESTTNGGKVEFFTSPKWLRMRRQGNSITSYISDDGLCWQERMKHDLANLGPSAFYGLALTSHNFGVLATGTATDLSFENNPGPVNIGCPQATYDGVMPEPTSWIAAPAKAGGSEWLYSLTNPNPGATDTRCRERDQDTPTNIAERRDGPDHPRCILNTGPLAWTQRVYSAENNWLRGTMGFGAQPRSGDIINTTWTGGSIWLRRTISLSSQAEIDNLMFWGRWSRGITIYVNGVLATHSEGAPDKYRYLGMRDIARRSLVIGNNVVAVRVEAFDWIYNTSGAIVRQNHAHKYLDLGITTNTKLANTHRAAITSAGSTFIQTLSDRTREFMQQQGIPGATLAVSNNDQVVGSWVYGYKTPALQTAMPNNAILRLASNDKVITRAIIVRLIEQGRNNPNGIRPDSRYFDFLQNKLGIRLQLPPQRTSPGANMNNVTIDHLIKHLGWIPEVPGSDTDRIAFLYGVAPIDWTPRHLVQWIFSLDTLRPPGSPPPPGVTAYSSTGHFLLRYLAAEILRSQGKTLEGFLATEMGLPGIVIAHERLLDRNPREVGYFTQDPLHDRHIFMEEFFALAADTEAFARYSRNFSIVYSLVNGAYVGEGTSHTGAMDGTTSLVLHNQTKKRSLMFNTTMAANFDELSEFLGQQFGQPECSWGNVDDPFAQLGQQHFIQNFWKPDQYLNREFGLRATPLGHLGWVSARWTINRVAGTSNYTIVNDWDGLNHLYVDTNDGNMLKAGTNTALPATTRQWRIEPVSPENPSLRRYRIRNAHLPDLYLATEAQNSDNQAYTPSYTVSLRNDHQNHWHSSQWHFCKVN